MDKNNGLLAKDGVSFLIPFVLITSCFALWGFANDITGPMVKAFSKIFRMSVTEGALVQVAFYLGYFVMAFPAALFIQRYSFKAGVLTGLTLYTAGALMFIPAQAVGMYYPFLLAYFIMTCGRFFSSRQAAIPTSTAWVARIQPHSASTSHKPSTQWEHWPACLWPCNMYRPG